MTSHDIQNVLREEEKLIKKGLLRSPIFSEEFQRRAPVVAVLPRDLDAEDRTQDVGIHVYKPFDASPFRYVTFFVPCEPVDGVTRLEIFCPPASVAFAATYKNWATAKILLDPIAIVGQFSVFYCEGAHGVYRIFNDGPNIIPVSKRQNSCLVVARP